MLLILVTVLQIYAYSTVLLVFLCVEAKFYN